MDARRWDAYLSLNRKTGADTTEDPASIAMFREFIETFRGFLSSPARVLAPGAISEALLLVEAGYDVHAPVLGADNLRWLKEKAEQLSELDLLVPSEQDAHALEYPPDYFDGYFSVQVHEHLLAPLVHIGEVRACMKDCGIVFVDACGTTNEACKAEWHTNLVPERTILEQWQFWGFKERWRGPHGDGRPQFIFEKLPAGHPDFKNSTAFDRVMSLRNQKA